MSRKVEPLGGGLEVHVSELTRQQLNMGHLVTLAFQAGEPKVPAEGQRCVSSKRGGLAGDVLFLRAVARSTKEDAFDVVHVHGDLPLAFVASRMMKGTPLMWTIHGGVNPRWFEPMLYRMTSRAYRAIVCVSHEIKESMQAMGVRGSQLHVCPSGVRAEFYVHHVTRREPPLRAVVVGRLVPIKGLSTAIMAIRELSDNVELHIVGDGPQRKELEILARGLPVTFHGRLGAAELVQLFQRSDVLIAPSLAGRRQHEGNPTAIGEAMAAGLPVIASALGGIPDAVIHEKNGLLLPPGSVSHLVNALRRLATDVELRQKLGEASAKVALDRTWPSVANRIGGIMESAT